MKTLEEYCEGYIIALKAMKAYQTINDQYSSDVIQFAEYAVRLQQILEEMSDNIRTLIKQTKNEEQTCQENIFTT